MHKREKRQPKKAIKGQRVTGRSKQTITDLDNRTKRETYEQHSM